MAQKNPSNSPGRPIALDVGNVVLDFDFGRAIERLAGPDPGRRAEILRFFRSASLADRFERGAVSAVDFYEEVRAALGLDPGFEAFRGAWNDIFTPHPGMEALIRRLAGTHPLFGATNTNALHLAHFKAGYPVFNLFASVVASNEIGVRKPAPGFYRILCERAGAAPGDMVFVDDLERNVEGARDFGLTALRFEGAEKLRQDLAGLGIAVP